MIERIFLNIIEGLSVSRFWLMPLSVIIVLALLAREIRMAFAGILDEMTHASPPPEAGLRRARTHALPHTGATQGKEGDE